MKMKIHQFHYENEILEVGKKEWVTLIIFLGRGKRDTQYEDLMEKGVRAFLKPYQMLHQHYRHE